MKKNYNSYTYIKQITGMSKLTLESILTKVEVCKKYPISTEVSDYLQYIDIEPFYVSPTFLDVKTQGNASTLNPKFILFSAPGATGKSALAKHIAHKFTGMYWDLSKMKLGTNSFIGSVLNAVGSDRYSEFVADLNTSKAMLVIDAFDEAETISGQTMINGFISDIDRNINSKSNASVFLLARTGTARNIASYCAEKNIPIRHYEIGFFEESQAKEFICRYISKKQNNTLNKAQKTCVDQYWETVRKNISAEESRSFLGYAPVLEAIASHILSEDNQAKLISDLKNQTNCVSIIMKIMNDLLEREHDKVVSAFKHKCKDQHIDFSDWENLYSSEEQLVRLINYTLFDDTEYTCFHVPELPAQLIEDYQEILCTFLPQHPYIRNSSIEKVDTENSIDFAGPAFRDFTLAKLILTENQFNSAHLYFDQMSMKHRSTSQIFFDCYADLAKGILALSDIAYVFESFCAKSTVKETPYLRFTATVDEDGTKQGIAVFEMECDDSTKSNCASSKHRFTEFSTKFCDEKVVFSKLINVFIDAPCLEVKIGSQHFDASIKNSSVICKQIEFCSNAVTFESFGSKGCCLISTDPILSKSPTRIEIYSDENLRISAPNINEFYRLIHYSYRFDDDSSIDILKFAHAIRCIMIEFRTHRKDTLAKDAERIDNVVVGSNSIKRKVLSYLKAREVIYRDAHLYKVDMGKMQNININYHASTHMDTDQLETAYHDFCSWEKHP